MCRCHCSSAPAVAPEKRELSPWGDWAVYRNLGGIAFDRASMRSIDMDGRLHLEAATVSMAAVNRYLGREIPGADELGLDPNHPYAVLRPPEELQRAAPTMNNVPVLDGHAIVDASDWKPDKVVGATGTDAKFQTPLLTVSLVIWAQPAVDRVEDGSCACISAGYRYEVDPSPGEYEGKRYDMAMKDLSFQHIALVPEGRIGAQSVIGDAVPYWLAEQRFYRRFRRLLAVPS
jgi:hypothetical protein